MILYCRFISPEDADRLVFVEAISNALHARGFRLAIAVNREAREMVRAHLGDRFGFYRLPEDESEALDRLIHLRKTHGHTNLLISSPPPDATWLHKATKGFPFVALLDWGYRFMLYAHLIINPDPSARDRVDHYAPEARLMLGPKFFPLGVREPSDAVSVEQILIDPGAGATIAESILIALSRMGSPARVHVLCPPAGKLFATLGARSSRWPGIDPEPTVRPNGPFPFRDHSLVITRAKPGCLALAGQLFVTVAMEKDQLGRSYVLEQLGVAPSLGWHEVVTPERAEALLEPLLEDEGRRGELVQAGLRLIDGKGSERIARAIPLEPKPDSSPSS